MTHPRSPRSLRPPARIGVALIVASSLAVVGCGGDGGAGGSSGAGAAKAAAGLPAEAVVETPAPKAGEVAKVTWALGTGEPLTLDPQKAGDYSPHTVESNMCDRVMQVQPDGTIVPNLASEVSTPDAKTVVFEIRDGITFWNGKPLTAEDVAYSLKRNMDPAVQAVNASYFLKVRSIEATGERQVTVRLKSPDPLFVSELITTAGSVSEKAFVEKAGKDYGTAKGGVMCSGPFEFVSWNAGKEITLKRNDAYWNAKLKPKVQELSFQFIEDGSTLTSALLSGAVDGAYEAPTASIPSLSRTSAGTLYRGSSNNGVLLGPTKPEGPGADPAFRQALNLAIDKAAIVRNAAGGAGEVMRTMLPRSVWAGNPAKAIYDAGYDALPAGDEPDIAAAKAKLAEMKTPVSRPVTMAIISGNQLVLRAATIIQASAKAIGVDIQIKQLQPTVYTSIYDDADVREKYDLFVSAGGIIEVPNPLTWAPLFLMPADAGGIFNYSNYSDPEVTKLIGGAQSEADPEKVAQAFVAAQKRFVVDGPIIPLTSLDSLLFMSKRITGAPASSTYFNYPWAAKLGPAS